jgi:lathosterol oxidase|tara:strand:+ start:74 stop:1063 length:990 start_codon:yes stop_codon:yes gene_type:complete
MNKNQNNDWNHHPNLPLKDTSIFGNMTSPKFLLNWFSKSWLSISEFVLLALLAIFLWAVCYPSLETAIHFQFNWIFQVLIVNFVVILCIAGGLHLYFYVYRMQDDKLKFDGREQARNNRSFLFSDQVKDNMFWSLSSGVLNITFFQVLTMWLMANGYIPAVSFNSLSIWFVVWFFLGFIYIPIWHAFHFYWVHRLLHIPVMYKKFHSLHHRNVNVGPWSGLSMHPVEHFLYVSSICIHWIILAHPIHLIFHILWVGPGACMSHTGYEELLIKDKRKLALGTFYHQLHHRYYECNYGNREMPWDKWFGTFHDGSTEATQETRARKKKMYS